MTSHLLWAWCALLAAMGGSGRNGGGPGLVIAKPIVDPGLFVIQGVSSCRGGDGYCMLGGNCTVDVDFLPDDEGGNCAGLREAFTPKIDFSCCKYNPLGKVTSEMPTTTLSSITVTDVFSILDEELLQQVQQQQQEQEMDYEDLNPDNLIDIVGVVTDFTGIVGLVTRPWTGTLPTRAPTPTTSPSTNKSQSSSQVTTVLLPSDEDLDGNQTEITESYHELPTTTFTPLPGTFLPREELQNSDDTLLTNINGSNATTSSPTTQNPIEALETTTGRDNQQGSNDYDYQTDYTDQLLLQPVNHNICGFKGPRMPEPNGVSRILGGVAASALEWCWVAALMERRPGGDKYICSGALIEPDMVLTTATCLRRLDRKDLSRYLVVLGDSNLRDDLPYGIQFHSITQVLLHPDYYTSGGAHASDIGLLKLRDRATLTDNVCLVCVAHQDAPLPSSRCVVVGYGLGAIPDTSHNPTYAHTTAYLQTPAFKQKYAEVIGGVPSEGVLRKLSVPLLGAEECRTVLHNVTGSKILAESNSFLCGGISQGAACYSTLDGGSPLGCEVEGRWFLAGLVSWSRDCSSPGRPSIYSRVSAFTGWVQAAYLRTLGFATSPLQTRRSHWIYHHLDKIDKDFA